MQTNYSTISKPSEGLFKDRGSKFIAFAYPVMDEKSIKEILDFLRKKYHDARHHCYAWKIGIAPAITRANDDGEPSNSAGRPILNQIESKGLTDVLVVVIRYFGGTLLGVGGLINAYRTAADVALGKSLIIIKKITKDYLLLFDYQSMNNIMKLIKEYNLEASDQTFELSCSLRLRIDIEKQVEVIEKLELIDNCSITEIEFDKL